MDCLGALWRISALVTNSLHRISTVSDVPIKTFIDHDLALEDIEPGFVSAL